MSDDFYSTRGMVMDGRLLEKRSKILDDFLHEHGLAEPKSVEYNPLRGSLLGWCFRNVTTHVSIAGGKMETGWVFFELVGVSMKTIAHAIWVTPQGRRMDITPWEFQLERRILFLPDDRVAAKRAYSAGYQTIYATDTRVVSMLKFEHEIDRIFESVCTGVDGVAHIPDARFVEAAEKTGVPQDVAREVVRYRMSKGGH